MVSGGELFGRAEGELRNLKSHNNTIMIALETVKIGDIVKISKGKKTVSIFDTPNKNSIRFIQIDA